MRISALPKNRLILSFTGTFLIASLAFASQVSTTTNSYAKDLALREFRNDPEMMRIIECESNFRQYDSHGNPLRSYTGDVGIMQIAPQYWEGEAEKLGYDIYTPEGNIEMGKVILKRQGYRAWVCYNNIAGWTTGRSSGS